MSFDIPAPLLEEHNELRAALARAGQAPGAVGEAAREVARLLEAHLRQEEKYVLPALSIMGDVVRGAHRSEMSMVLGTARKLKAELPAMFAEHRVILAAVQKLAAAARAAGLPEVERFAHELARHSQVEELVIYPAAVLLGEHLARVMEEEPVL